MQLLVVWIFIYSHHTYNHEQAIEIQRANFLDDHPAFAIRLNNRAMIYLEADKHQEACDDFRAAEAVLIAAGFPETHPHRVHTRKMIEPTCG